MEEKIDFYNKSDYVDTKRGNILSKSTSLQGIRNI